MVGRMACIIQQISTCDSCDILLHDAVLARHVLCVCLSVCPSKVDKLKRAFVQRFMIGGSPLAYCTQVYDTCYGEESPSCSFTSVTCHSSWQPSFVQGTRLIPSRWGYEAELAWMISITIPRWYARQSRARRKVTSLHRRRRQGRGGGREGSCPPPKKKIREKNIFRANIV